MILRNTFYLLIAFMLFGFSSLVAGDEKVSGNSEQDFSRRELLLMSQLLKDFLHTEDLRDEEKPFIEQLQGKVLSKASGVKPESRDSLETLKGKLKDALREYVAENYKESKPRVDLAKFYIFDNDPEKALRHLEKVGPSSEKDIFWPLLCSYCFIQLGNYSDAAKMLVKVDECVEKFLPIKIDRAQFCEEIRQHGQYTPRRGTKMTPGEAVWVYLEINGATFKEMSDKSLKLFLKFGLELRDELQRTVWHTNDYSSITPVYQHPVREVFAGLDYVIPQDIGPGKYTLIISVTDINSDKKTTADIVFEIGEKKSVNPAGHK